MKCYLCNGALPRRIKYFYILSEKIKKGFCSRYCLFSYEEKLMKYSPYDESMVDRCAEVIH